MDVELAIRDLRDAEAKIVSLRAELTRPVDGIIEAMIDRAAELASEAQRCLRCANNRRVKLAFGPRTNR